jgi:hypothetical protein
MKDLGIRVDDGVSINELKNNPKYHYHIENWRLMGFELVINPILKPRNDPYEILWVRRGFAQSDNTFFLEDP